MEIFRVILPCSSRVLAGLSCLALLAGCSSVDLSGEKVDYKSSSTKTNSLEVPPDLTQLTRESRYQQPNSGTVSASTFQTPTAAAPTTTSIVPAVALQSVGAFKIERLGNERWLSTTLTPEEVFPQVRAFWKDNGFTLVQDRADAGVLETDWAENRAKLPHDIIRGTIGKVIDSVYSTGELDKFRTRVERTATGSDIYVTHRRMEEVYTNSRKEQTVWQPGAVDPQLEATFLSRLMIKLGAKDEPAKTAAAATPGAPGTAPPGTAPTAATPPARARIVEAQATPTLQLDDGFDRAWRRVGIALDRSGFTVEDRDRAQGLYFVRYVDPKFAGREEPSWLSRTFSFGSKKDEGGLAKYRIKVSAEGSSSTVAVFDSAGKPETTENGKRIVTLLLEDLR
jgi:outer membrane protein assembly factor BamC